MTIHGEEDANNGIEKISATGDTGLPEKGGSVMMVFQVYRQSSGILLQNAGSLSPSTGQMRENFAFLSHGFADPPCHYSPFIPSGNDSRRGPGLIAFIIIVILINASYCRTINKSLVFVFPVNCNSGL
jgi:hypothetical protein